MSLIAVDNPRKRFNFGTLLGSLAVLCLLSLFGGAPSSLAATATIDANTTNQFIRGYGASSAWHTAAYPANLATWFWDSTGMTGNNPNGIGLSMLRCRIPPDTSNGELAVMQQAKNLGCTQIWATEWSAPANYKSNNNVNNGGILNTGSYAAYATKLVNYANTIRAQGITLMCISPQNEPDWHPNYESGQWSGQLFHDFIKNNMGPAFVGNPTKIMMPEPSKNMLLNGTCGADGDAMCTLNDASAATFVSYIGTHLYGSGPLAFASTQLNAPPGGREYWETEMSDVSGAANDTGVNAGLQVAAWVHNSMVVASMNAYHAWWLYPASGNTNESLIGTDNASTKKLWMFGNWSRFVRPGYYRMGGNINSGAAGVSISAYKNANSAPSTIVIVAINGGTGATSETFTLSNATLSTVTPWVTDASNNLTRQANLTVTGGNSFTFNLPARSVVSFVCVTGAAGPTPTRTNTPIPGAFCLVDDVEDLDTNNLWSGGWGSYQGTSSTVTLTMAAGGSTGSTAGSASITGTIGANDYGGVYTGLVNTGVTNISNYIGVAFMVKGNGSNYWFQVPNDAVTTGDHYGVTFTAPAAWTPVTLLFANAVQRGFGAGQPFDLTQVTALQWGGAAAGALNFQIDDVKLLGAYCPGGPATSTRTSTPTFTRTPTPVPPTNTSTATLTRTATASSTNTPPAATNTSTSTLTRTATASSTHTPPPATNTSTLTRTATASSTNTPVPPTSTSTATLTTTRTATNTGVSTNTSTSTSTSTLSPTRTATQTSTLTQTLVPSTPTSTQTSTLTRTPTTTATLTATASSTQTRTLTASPTFTDTGAPTGTRTSTSTLTATLTQSPTRTPTLTATLTQTQVPSTPTSTLTATLTRTATASATLTSTSSSTQTRTLTASPTFTDTGAPTGTSTSTLTQSPSRTATSTLTLTQTLVPTLTPTSTTTSSNTSTRTSTASATETSTRTDSPTVTQTPTGTLQPTNTLTLSPTSTSSATQSQTSTTTSTSSATQTSTSTSTLTQTTTPTLTRSSTATPTATDTLVNSPTSTATSSRTVSATASQTSTPTPTQTSTNTLVNTVTPTSTRTASLTATITLTSSQTSTPTATRSQTSTSTATPTETSTLTTTITLTPSQTPTATQTVESGDKPVIFPNPSDGDPVEVLPQRYNGTSDIRVRILTVGFKLVADKTYLNIPSGDTVTIDMIDKWGQPLASGLYYVEVTTKKNTAVGKLMILR